MKEDLRIKKTKASLYRSILFLMEKEKYEDIKISQICSKAKINRSTYYDHFKDKDELIQTLIEDLIIDLESSILWEKETKTIKEYYGSLIESILNHIKQNQKEYITIANTNKIQILKETMIQHLTTKTMQETKKRYPKISQETIENNTLFYISGIINVLIESLKINITIDNKNIYQTIMNLISTK